MEKTNVLFLFGTIADHSHQLYLSALVRYCQYGMNNHVQYAKTDYLNNVKVFYVDAQEQSYRGQM